METAPGDAQRDLLLGFDIGGTKCAAVVGVEQPAGSVRVLGRRAFATIEAPRPEQAVPRLLDEMEMLLEEHEHAGRPRAAGISCGGPLCSRRGLVLSPPNLPGWDAVPVVELAARRFRLPTALENDANAGALAEWWWGAGRGARDLVFLTLGTGLGAGLIVDGRLHRGAIDFAGEVGHVRLAADGPEGHGKRGSFEGFCSGGGVVRRLLADGDMPADLRTVCDRAARGDRRASAILDEVGERLGEGIAILVDVLNPEVIVLGGLYARHAELLSPALQKRLRAEALAPALSACRIVPAALGETIGDHACLAVARGTSGVSAVVERAIASVGALVALEPALHAAAAELLACLGRGGKVLVCGNGGSAAEAQHLVGELVGRYRGPRRPLPAVHLGGDLTLMSCVGNDFGWADTNARPLRALAAPGDVLVCFSTSGESENVLRALEEARTLRLPSIALLGGGGGRAGAPASHPLVVPGGDTARVQEAHNAPVPAGAARDQDLALRTQEGAAFHQLAGEVTMANHVRIDPEIRRLLAPEASA